MTFGAALTAVVLISVCSAALMALEALIPGISVAGLTGVVLFFLGAVLCWNELGAAATFILSAAYGVVVFAAMRNVFRSMKSGRLSKSGIFMKEENVPAVHRAALSPKLEIGRCGISKTPLRPSGIAVFGDDRIHVSAIGGYIEENMKIRVVRIEGTRVVVEKTEC